MQIKVSRMPGRTVEVAVEEGSTVATALEVADFAMASNEKVSVNGETVGSTFELEDGDVVLLTKDAKSA
jgi:sulfur carrier protein ThiS